MVDQKNLGVSARGGKRDFYYKRNPVRALMGMAVLTLEERGAYGWLIDYAYMRGQLVEDDDAFIAANLGVQGRVWKRVKAQLVAKGRIRLEGGLIVDDATLEGLAEREAARQLAVVSGSVGGLKSAAGRAVDNRPKQNKTELNRKKTEFSGIKSDLEWVEVKQIKNLGQGPLNQVESESELDTRPLSFLTGEGDLLEVAVRAAEADPNAEALHLAGLLIAGEGLTRDVGRLALTAVRLLEARDEGCDLRADMLPVIAERTRNERDRPIDNWGYFTEAFRECRRARQSGAESGGEVVAFSGGPGNPRKRRRG